MKEDRAWEAWSPAAADRLAGAWANPKRGAVHARLMTKAASLVVGNGLLDVGCGVGGLYPLIKGMNIDYLGIDSSPAMLAKAREAYPEAANRFLSGDAYDLSKFSKADTVLAIGLILHLPNPGKIVAQLCDRAKQCVVMTACIGDKPQMKTAREGSGERYFILRQDTSEDIRFMIKSCQNIACVEEMPFANKTFGESNYFFRIWKEQTCAG